MWGNTLGWFLSMLLVLATAGALWLLERAVGAMTPTTALVADASLLAPLVLPLPPGNLVAPNDPSDAGPIYRSAIDAYDRDPAPYDDFARRGTSPAQVGSLEAIERLIEASTHARAELFTSDPAQLISYDRPNPAIDAIQALGQCLIRAALLAQKSDPAAALRHAEAAFVLGARLVEERLTLAELRLGLSLLDQAARLIATLDPARASAAREFYESLRTFTRDRIDPLARAIVTIDPALVAQHAGDVFHISRQAPERMWRVEAILALGRMRFHAARVGDQRAAEKRLDRLQFDPDPAIATAARAARNLTLEQYRLQG